MGERRHTPAADRPDRASGRAEVVAARPTVAADLLAWQRAAGNHAVMGLIGRRGALPAVQRGGTPAPSFPVAPPVTAADAPARARTIEEAFHSSVFTEDEELALEQIRNQPPPAIKAISAEYRRIRDESLHEEFRRYVDAAQLKEAMGWIRPSLNLEERLRLNINPHLWGLYHTENEGAMLAELKRTTPEELREAAPAGSSVRAFLSDRLNAEEYYEASRILDPEHLLDATIAFIKDAPGTVNDDEDGTYNVIIRLGVADRRTLWAQHEGLFDFMNAAEKASVRLMCTGTEAQALKERMRLATEGAGTDDPAVKLVVEQAAGAAARERAIKASLASGNDPQGQPLTPEARAALQAQLTELGGVEANLLTVERDDDGDLDGDSFLGMLHGDVSPGEFQAFTAQMGVAAFDRAKQQVLDAFHWYNDDEDSVYQAFDKLVGTIELPADQLAALTPQARAVAQRDATRALRQALLADDDVKAQIEGHMNAEERAKVATLVSADSYAIALQKLQEAYDGVDTDEEGIYAILLDMSPADRYRLQAELPTIYYRLVYQPSALTRQEQEITSAIISTGRMPTEKALDWAMDGDWDGTKEDTIFRTFDTMPDDERAEYRLGYFLATKGAIPVPPGPDQDAQLRKQQAAKAKFEALHARLRSELGDDDLEKALDALVGKTTLADLVDDQSRVIAAHLLRQRVMSRGGHRDEDWTSTSLMDTVSESGGIADDAHTRFLVAYNSALADGKVSPSELAVLMAFESEQDTAYADYVATVDQVSGFAATAAAIAVGILITVVSDGTLAPVAAKLIEGAGGATLVAGVAGAVTRVAVHEAFAGSHFDALSAEGGKDALVGAVDAAFPALTKGLAGSLTSRFAGLVGLGGDALAAEATTGVVLASDAAITQAGKKFVVGAFREGIQGMLAGMAGEVVLKATDEKTWRQTVARIIETFGEAILTGGGIGAATGALMGGALDALSGVVGVARVRGLVATLEQAGVDGKRLAGLPLGTVRALGQVDKLFAAGQLDEAAKLLATLRPRGMDAAEIEGVWRSLGRHHGVSIEPGRFPEIFGSPLSSVVDQAEAEARLRDLVTNNMTEKQKAATTPKHGVVAAGELHVEGQPTPASFVEQSGGAGTGTPDAVHVLGPDEVPLHDQLAGETIPSVPESTPTGGVDEAFPNAQQRHEARRKEYLAANRAAPEHSGPRSHDAERKVLDDASARLAKNPTAAGELHLMPSHPPCPACTAAIHAFIGDHPNVKVFLYDFRRH